MNQVLVDPDLIFQGMVAGGLVPPGVPCQFVLTTCDPFGYIFGSLAAGNPLLDAASSQGVPPNHGVR